MGDAVSVTILCVAEDRLGFTLAQALFERVCVEEGLDGSAQWQSLDAPDAYTRWTSMRDRARRTNLRFTVKGLGGYEFETRRVLTQLALLSSPPQVVVLCRDTDNKPVRDEMNRAIVAMGDLPFTVLSAVAHREAEAWVVAGFEARDERERRALRALQQSIGFDPTREPHRMTANDAGSPRDAKRVCEALLEGPALGDRGRMCWEETPLTVLIARGVETGIPEYVASVRSWRASVC